MNMQPPSCALVIVLIATQVLGSATLWAAEQGGIQVESSNRVVIAAISDEQLTAQSTNGSTTLHFGDTVHAGDQIATGDRTVAEVLIGNRAVLTLRPSTTVELTTVSPEQTTIQVTHGIVRVAASAAGLGEQGSMIIQTPTGQVQTRGGIVRVMVDTPVGSVEQAQAGAAKPYLTSYAPHPMVAAIDTRGDSIQVEEGTAQIAGAGPGGEALTVEAGQSVTRQAGQAGSMSELVTSGDMRAGVLANTDHANTPQEGLEHLVALQVDQASALGRALTGETELGQGPDYSAEKDDVQNAIIGPTGGVSGNTSTSTIVATLFGAVGSSTSNPTESTGSGFTGVVNNDVINEAFTVDITTKVNGPARAEGSSEAKALLVFTSKDPLKTFVKKEFTTDGPGGQGSSVGEVFKQDDPCTPTCYLDRFPGFDGGPVRLGELEQRRLDRVMSEFTVVKELVLVGGTPNDFHGGIAPTKTLIIRGTGPKVPSMSATNISGGFNNSTSLPDETARGFYVEDPWFDRIVSANSTFVTESFGFETQIGGSSEESPTFDQFTSNSFPFGVFGDVDGAITATGSDVVLTGGVTLDRGTKATIGTTMATDNYFFNPDGTPIPDHNISGAESFKGSLLAVIHGPPDKDNENYLPTSVTVQDRLLGVYDGSTIKTDGDNKALLSILDAKLELKGPAGVPLIDINAAFKDADKAKGVGGTPDVTVTSAVVTRSTMKLGVKIDGDTLKLDDSLYNENGTLKLDHALLEASAPLLALTHAMMTTKNHFADLAGNQAQSIRLGTALVALNASDLIIKQGNLLNLNNATATVNGYLFSLNDKSSLLIESGALFSLNNRSSLNLNANAFGVFGRGNNTLNITNDLCKATTCGTLVNSVNAPIMVNGSALQVAGFTQDVNVPLPSNFNVFEGNPARTVNISTDAALFHVDKNSTLTINGTPVVPVPVKP